MAMTKETREKTTALVKAILAADSCCPELKTVGQAWLDAAGTAREAELTKTLIAELEEDVTPIDHVIEFFGSPAAANAFGEETAAKLLAAQKAAKAAGGKYCICDACQNGAKILAMKGELL